MLKCLLYIIIYSKSSCVSQNDRYQEDQHKLVDAKLSTLRGLVGTSWWKLRKSQKVVTPSSLFYLCHTFFVISLNISTTLKSGRTRKRPASFRLVNRVQSIRSRDPAHTRIWFESKSVYTYACTLSRTVSIAARNRRGIDAGLSMWSLIRVIPFPLFLFFSFSFPCARWWYSPSFPHSLGEWEFRLITIYKIISVSDIFFSHWDFHPIVNDDY